MVLYEIQTSMVVEARHRPYISIRRQSLWRIPRLLQQADGVPATAFEFGSCTDGSRETWTIRSWGAAIEALSQRVCSFHHWGLGFRQYSFSPYHAGLAGRHRKRLRLTPAFLACSFPLRLSPSGKPDGPETSLRVSPDCVRDSAPRSAAHVFTAPGSPSVGLSRSSPCGSGCTTSRGSPDGSHPLVV